MFKSKLSTILGQLLFAKQLYNKSAPKDKNLLGLIYFNADSTSQLKVSRLLRSNCHFIHQWFSVYKILYIL